MAKHRRRFDMHHNTPCAGAYITISNPALVSVTWAHNFHRRTRTGCGRDELHKLDMDS